MNSRREPRELRQRNSPIPWSSLESFRPITWYEFSPLKNDFSKNWEQGVSGNY